MGSAGHFSASLGAGPALRRYTPLALILRDAVFANPVKQRLPADRQLARGLGLIPVGLAERLNNQLPLDCVQSRLGYSQGRRGGVRRWTALADIGGQIGEPDFVATAQQ